MGAQSTAHRALFGVKIRLGLVGRWLLSSCFCRRCKPFCYARRQGRRIAVRGRRQTAETLLGRAVRFGEGGRWAGSKLPQTHCGRQQCCPKKPPKKCPAAAAAQFALHAGPHERRRRDLRVVQALLENVVYVFHVELVKQFWVPSAFFPAGLIVRSTTSALWSVASAKCFPECPTVRRLRRASSPR